MSLVERALRKLQESRGPTPTPPTRAPVPAADALAKPAVAPPAPQPAVRRPPTVSVPVDPSRHVAIKRETLRANGLLPPEHEEREVAEQYRQIKRPLIAKATGRGVPKLENGQLIVVGSALPGEGKTFTSLNLALSIAKERELKVVLVDADVAKPHISRVLGIEKERGLLDALSDETLALESLILPTDVPGLSVVPAGRPAENAAELLASSRMETVLSTIALDDPHRIVLLDSPPLLLTSESRALISSAGQIVLVVRAGWTSQQAVLDAISYIEGNKSIGLILNQCEGSVSEGYYPGRVPYGAAEADE